MYSLLVVDDEPLTREYLLTNISAIHGAWSVAGEAEDGQDALAFLEKQPVDLVITDIKMPLMDGLELCHHLSLKYPGQKVIILSGYDEFAYAREAILYGVNEYLLKPIVKENLWSALENIAQKIEQERSQERVYNSLLSLSRDSAGHVVRKFLQALVHESNVEIKTLLPLIHRMKVSLMEGVGVVTLLTIDEEALLAGAGQPPDRTGSDLSIYKYILYQAAVERTAEGQRGWAFLDADQNTCVFSTGEDSALAFENSRAVTAELYHFLQASSGLTLTACAGAPVDDLLQLHLAYKSARKLLLCSLVPPERGAYRFDAQAAAQVQARFEAVQAAFNLLKVGFVEGNEVNIRLALANLTGLVDCTDARLFLRCGVAILRGLSSLKPEITAEQVEGALRLLRGSLPAAATSTPLTKEGVLKRYLDLVGYLAHNPLTDDPLAGKGAVYQPEQLISKVKEYISAHFAEPISLALIADQVGVSSGYLSQVFHKTTGESYIQYLTKVRMEQAAKLLKAYPDCSIAQVSERVGYLGAKHFSYVFKQYYGMTPGEFRAS